MLVKEGGGNGEDEGGVVVRREMVRRGVDKG